MPLTNEWIYSLDRITVSQAGTPRHDNCVRLPVSWKTINNWLDVIQLGPFCFQLLFQFVQVSDACFVHPLSQYSHMQYCHIPLMPRQWNLAGHQQTQSTSVRLTDVAMLGGTMSGHSCAPWHYRSGELLQTIEWCHCKLHFVRLSAGLYMSEETVWLQPSPGKLCNATRLSVCLSVC